MEVVALIRSWGRQPRPFRLRCTSPSNRYWCKASLSDFLPATFPLNRGIPTRLNGSEASAHRIQLGASSFRRAISVDLEGGDDSLWVQALSVDGRVRIEMDAGDDTVKVTGIYVDELNISTASGNDQTSILSVTAGPIHVATGLEHSLELSTFLQNAAELVRHLSEADCQRLAELLLDSTTGAEVRPREKASERFGSPVVSLLIKNQHELG